MELYNNIEKIREQFPALAQRVNNRELVYFDNGATAQKPIGVISLLNEMNSGINGNIHRAVHELSARSTVLYEGARDAVKMFINAGDRGEIIFTSGTTASINLVANSFTSTFIGKGDVILLTEAEHHSNLVPWQMACRRSGAELRFLPVDEQGNWRMHLLDELLDKRVKLVSVAHISNVLGIINPVKELIDKAHSAGAKVLIDGAQGIVHSQVDVKELDCDFYVFSGHKLYGPTGTGVLYGKKSLLEEMVPWMGGGDMVGTVTLENFSFAELPLKFEAGTPNFIGAAALGEAIKFVQSIDSAFAEKHENEIGSFIVRELSKIDGIRIYGLGENKIPLFSFNIEGIHPSDLAILLNKMGVAVRSGMMCCEPLMNKYGVTGMLRASLAVYNTMKEAEMFIESIKRGVRMLS
jgi:cysteine desulfurase/selenocysteine lyase